jgi:hypothetical protein
VEGVGIQGVGRRTGGTALDLVLHRKIFPSDVGFSMFAIYLLWMAGILATFGDYGRVCKVSSMPRACGAAIAVRSERLDKCFGLLASTEIWAGSGEHLSAIETKLCAPMQWPQSNAGIWALLGRGFVLGQYASQIQRQHLLEFSHNQDFPFGICFPIECHHASDYL